MCRRNVSRLVAWAAPLLTLTSCGAPGFGQAPAVDVTAASTPSKTTKLDDLSRRYRFTERYAKEDGPEGSGVIGPYRVGVLEVLKESIDTPQGAPRQAQSTRQAIYLDRPAEVAASVSVVRSFERFMVRPEDRSAATVPKPLEGLLAYVNPRPSEPARILSLTDGRRLTEFEFDVASKQVSLPQMAAMLPTQPVRVGDTWRVTRRGAQAIVGEFNLTADALTARLVEIRREVDGPRKVAYFSVTGKATCPAGEARVNSEVVFTFRGEPNANPAPTVRTFPPRPPGADAIDARGAITEARIARVISGALPGAARLRYQTNREVVVHRQLNIGTPGLDLPKLDAAPEATEANSWIDMVDPSGKFALRHPQEFLPPARTLQTPDTKAAATLVRIRRDGTSLLQIQLEPKSLTPDDLRDKLKEKWGPTKLDVTKGEEAWLPESDWPEKRVHRIEASLKGADPTAGTGLSSGSGRIHFDGYLVLFGQSVSVLAIATTTSEAVPEYRREVEQILRTITLDPVRPVSN